MAFRTAVNRVLRKDTCRFESCSWCIMTLSSSPARTLPSQGGNMGSNPIRVANIFGGEIVSTWVWSLRTRAVVGRWPR